MKSNHYCTLPIDPQCNTTILGHNGEIYTKLETRDPIGSTELAKHQVRNEMKVFYGLTATCYETVSVFVVTI